MLLVEPGMTGATGNIYTGLHEFSDMAFALHLLRKDDLFVDIGANIGSYTVLAASVGAKSISIEPIKNAFDHLIRNIHLNDIGGSVDARQIGISSSSGTLKFTNGLDTVNHVVNGQEQTGSNTCEVQVAALDDVIAGLKPVLIKIDVEGFEREVVAGAKKALAEKSLLAVIMELNGSGNRYSHDESELYARMVDYGFTACSYGPEERRLNQLNGKNRSGGNTLFVRDVETVCKRLTAAPNFSVMGRSL